MVKLNYLGIPLRFSSGREIEFPTHTVKMLVGGWISINLGPHDTSGFADLELIQLRQ